MPLIETGGRHPSGNSYVLRGLIFLVVFVLLLFVLWLRYEGKFTSKTEVTARLAQVGDGLVSNADVRFDGLVVGSVRKVEKVKGLEQYDVDIDLKPNYAKNIPAGVVARTVPSNIFGVNSVELLYPRDDAGQTVSIDTSQRLKDGSLIKEATDVKSVKLQDALNNLRELFKAVPPEDLGRLVSIIASRTRGSGQVVNLSIGLLNQAIGEFNGLFPNDAPPGFGQFDQTLRAISDSTPDVISVLNGVIEPSQTIANNRRNLGILLNNAQTTVSQTGTAFAKNGDTGIVITKNIGITVGALMLDRTAMPSLLAQLYETLGNILGAQSGTNGHLQFNFGLSFTPLLRNNATQCPVYDGGQYGILRGPNCSGPGTGTNPGGGLEVHPSAYPGAVTSNNDKKTLTAALNRTPTKTEQFLFAPYVPDASLESK